MYLLIIQNESVSYEYATNNYKTSQPAPYFIVYWIIIHRVSYFNESYILRFYVRKHREDFPKDSSRLRDIRNTAYHRILRLINYSHIITPHSQIQ